MRRPESELLDPPPDYGPHGGLFTLSLHHGGDLSPDLSKWVGGGLIKFDYLPAEVINIHWLIGYACVALDCSPYIVFFGKKTEGEGFFLIRTNEQLRGLVNNGELEVWVLHGAVADKLLGLLDEVESEEDDVVVIEDCGKGKGKKGAQTKGKKKGRGTKRGKKSRGNLLDGDELDIVEAVPERGKGKVQEQGSKVQEKGKGKVQEQGSKVQEKDKGKGKVQEQGSKVQEKGKGKGKVQEQGSKVQEKDKGKGKIQDKGKVQDKGKSKATEGEDSIFDSDFEYQDSFSSGSEDDLLFSKNIDDGYEWLGEHGGGVEGEQHTGDEEVVDDFAEFGDEDLLLSEDDFPVLNEGDEDNVTRQPVYSTAHKNTPAFALGMIFANKKEFKELVDAHAIIEGRSVYFTKSNKSRSYARCSQKDCEWKINLRRRPSDGSFEITTLYGDHTCVPEYNVKNMNSNWLTERYGYQFKGEKNRSVEGFRDAIINEVRCHVTWWQAYRCKRMALKSKEGDGAAQYGLLWNYANEIRRTNPGSTVLVGVEDVGGENKFSRFYVCLGALKEGFLKGCRPLFGVDGTFLKGPYGGILLTAVGVDPNNNLYPIAWAVVNREDGANWDWFLRTLKSDFGIERDYEWTIISDKQKGLIRAVQDVFPCSAHRFCVQHMHSNFMSAGFRGQAWKIALWRAAKATTINDFTRRMEEIKQMDAKAYEWFNDKHPEQWSRSHFGTAAKCDMLLNNICESFNAMIVPAREMHILSMLESIMGIVMKRLRQGRERGQRWKGPFCPRIKKVIEFNGSKVPDCRPVKSTDVPFQISCVDGTQYAVDLEKRSCGCRKWDLTGIPCKHAMSAIRAQKLDVNMFIDQCYSVETYRTAYRACIMPMNGRQEWPQLDAIPPLPPKLIRQAGRPPKARRREPDELIQRRKRKCKGRPPHLDMHTKKRNQETTKCGRCGEAGHNRRSCLRRDEGQQLHDDEDFTMEEELLAELEEDMQSNDAMMSQMVSQVTQEHPMEHGEDMDDALLMEIDKIRAHPSSHNPSSSQQASSSQHISSLSQVVEQVASVPIPSQTLQSPFVGSQTFQSQPGLKIRAPSPFVGNQTLPPRLFSPPQSHFGPIVSEGGSKYLILSNNQDAVKGKKK